MHISFLLVHMYCMSSACCNMQITVTYIFQPCQQDTSRRNGGESDMAAGMQEVEVRFTISPE
ncbi:MAG: hypothetical protein D3924_07520 [Candidatus Electrothrix sp. AR4]|nr:hypothetical protein [Candidatus Electrothrix sp. AR4]